jgi:hypothetical protein
MVALSGLSLAAEINASTEATTPSVFKSLPIFAKDAPGAIRNWTEPDPGPEKSGALENIEIARGANSPIATINPRATKLRNWFFFELLRDLRDLLVAGDGTLLIDSESLICHPYFFSSKITLTFL